MNTDLHFSILKHHAKSPAHVRHAMQAAFEPTRAMRIGTCVHNMVLGEHKARKLAVYPGDRRAGGAWEKFAKENEGADIVTRPEWEDAKPVAMSVLTNPVSSALLRGTRREVPIAWTDAGVQCATDGIDFVGDGYIGDLKTTSCTEPANFSRHAFKMAYHCQMAWMQRGAKANGVDTSKGLYLIGVEVEPPYPVTVLRLSAGAIDQGEKTVSLWIERHRACVENDFWPEYTQTIVDFELPAWVGGDDDE